MNFYLITMQDEREKYYTGKQYGDGVPAVTTILDRALGFATPREAYQHAADIPELRPFKVGRRPHPLKLRNLNDAR